MRNPPANAGVVRALDSVSGLGRPPGREHGSPLLEDPMDRGAWWATVHGDCTTLKRVSHDFETKKEQQNTVIISHSNIFLVFHHTPC